MHEDLQPASSLVLHGQLHLSWLLPRCPNSMTDFLQGVPMPWHFPGCPNSVTVSWVSHLLDGHFLGCPNSQLAFSWVSWLHNWLFPGCPDSQPCCTARWSQILMDSTKGFPANEHGITKPAHSCVKRVAHAFLCIGMQFLKRSCAGGFSDNCLELLEGF